MAKRTRDLKKRVFDAAWEIVETKGVEELNARRLAEMSGCALGSLYTVFESFLDLKLQINAAILNRFHGAIQKALEKGITEEKGPKDCLKRLGLAYVAFGESNKHLWKALFEHLPYESMPEWYVKHTRDGIQKLCQRFSVAFHVPPKEARRAIGFYWAAIHGMTAICLNQKTATIAELIGSDSLEPYLNYCLDGLKNM